jgi:NAD(P)-dependent dehydrogenase (short-subunit alcohol dehydrogenase family)
LTLQTEDSGLTDFPLARSVTTRRINLARHSYEFLLAGSSGLQSPFLLLLRLYFFWQLFLTGKGKLANIGRVSEFFASLGIPLPTLNAYGKVGGPTAAVYVGSKHAVKGITKSAAIELAGTGVRVNIVGPGPVETGMFNRFAQTKENKANFLAAQVPNKRIGTPEEIANAIVFIASDKASDIIGASLAVDGGMIAD